MHAVYRSPHPALAPFVDFLGYFRMAGPPARERVLPAGDLQLLVNLREDELRTYHGDGYDQVQRTGGAVLQGARSRHSVIDTNEQEDILLVGFKPGGAFPFFAAPQSATAGQLVEIENLWGRNGGILRDRLLDQVSPEGMLGLLEATLLKQAVRPLEADRSMSFAVEALDRGVQVADVVDHLGMSSKRFVRRFSDQVGVTPKRFSRLRRFQRVLHAIPHGRPADWAALAATCGYFDQSHLISEFRAFSGLTPTEYQPRSSSERNHVPL